MRPLVSGCIFSAAALVGPLIRLAIWPPSDPGGTISLHFERFLYDFILLIWPTQPLAVMEESVGTFAAAAVAVGANVILFALAGIGIGAAGRRRSGLVASYGLVCALVIASELWGAGSDPEFVNLTALLLALGFYAIPFWGIARAVPRPLGESAPGRPTP